MAVRDKDVMVINDYGGGSLKRRTSSSGKQRYTVTIKSDPILVNTDGQALVAKLAESIAQHYRDEISNISAPIAPATAKAQAVQEAALKRGEPWVAKRYSGGRMGSMPPQRTGRLFNNSGRFIKSIVARATQGGWVINFAANRGDPMTTAGEAGLVRMFDRLREFVPSWGNANELKNVLAFRRALNATRADLLRIANEKTADLGMQLFKRALRLVA